MASMSKKRKGNGNHEKDIYNNKYGIFQSKLQTITIVVLILIVCFITVSEIKYPAGTINKPALIETQMSSADKYQTNINRFNTGKCQISPVFPMSGPAGCREPCAIHNKYKSGMTFHGPWKSIDGTNYFSNNYINATNIIKNNPKYKYYTLDHERAIGIHMAMHYTCCLSFPQTIILDKIYANFSFDPIEITFDKVECVLDGRYRKAGYHWTDESSHVSLVIYVDQISQQKLYQITDKFERLAMEYNGNDIKDNELFGYWKQTRRESQPFHVTIGVMYGNESNVEQAVDDINQQISIWNEKPIRIEPSMIIKCNTDEKGHHLEGYNHYFDCWLPKKIRKSEMMSDDYQMLR
eukprot:391421_1